MDDETLKIWAYVNISSYRAKTVKALKDEIKTPSDLAADTGIRINHISNVLRELKEKDVAECINNSAKKGRIYRLTSLGEVIVEHLE